MSGRPFTIVGAVVAVLALVIFIFIGSRSGQVASSISGTGGQKAVIVAARDIAIRVPLTAADVKVIKVDAAAVPPLAFDKVDQLKGLIPVVGISKDQMLTSNLLVTSSDQVTGAQAAFLPIPKGFVALTIPTGEQQGVAGFIQPGDYIAIQAVIGRGLFQNTRTIFTQVHVLRTGVAAVTTAPAQNGKPAPAPTPSAGISSSLTIVVTQCQAEFLNWFLANGAIKYTLESYKDYSPKDVAVDTSCPNVDAAGGVSVNQINQRYPGLLTT